MKTKNPKILFLIPLMLLSSILLVPSVAHAATGQVSVNGGKEIVSGQTDTSVAVPIQISGSDNLNGFDIQVLADPTILQGANVSLTNSVLPSPRLVIECINGILIIGNSCAPQDQPGVVHFAVVQVGSLFPGTGLLFTINYNLVGHSPGTQISFNTGCTGTSVLGDCVTISNGTPTPNSETDLGATFANLNDFSITPKFAKISTPTSTNITDTITYTALGAFSDVLTETVTGGPCTLALGSVSIPPTATDKLTCKSATTGDFNITVTASGLFSGNVHSVVIPLKVAAAGFSGKLSQASVTVPRGFSDSTTVLTLTGVSGFSGPVAISATGPAGVTVTASPSMVTLTPDASGYSTAQTTLTVSVGPTTATNTYPFTVTGGVTLNVVVPLSKIGLAISPASLAVPRGGTVAATLTVCSIGAFSGDVNLSGIATGTAVDNDGVNNIVTSFLPPTVTLTPGGCAQTAFFASTVKIGATPNPANTATGNYTDTITASASSTSSTTQVIFLVQDFLVGPSFCSGTTPVVTTVDTEVPVAYIGEQCNTFTITTQATGINLFGGSSDANLLVEVQSLGGLTTRGATGYGIQGGDPSGPGRGRSVPELGIKACVFQTYFANGTQIPYPYLLAHGPIVRGDPYSGCRGFGEAFPNDVEQTPYVPNNPDFLPVTADALSTTAPGTYGVNVCGLFGTLINCEMVTLIVVSAPVVHQFVYTHRVSVASGGTQTFKLGVTNTDLSHVLYGEVMVTATGSLGDTYSVTTSVFTVNPNANTNNLALSLTFTKANEGEIYTFSSTILVSAVDPGGLAVSPPAGYDAYFGTPITSAGISTLQSIVATFTVGP